MRSIPLVFSPCGSTAFIGRLLSKEASYALVAGTRGPAINLTTPLRNIPIFTDQDIVFVGCPTYAGRCPAVFIDRLKTIPLSGIRVACYVTWGNRAFDDSLLELSDVLHQQGAIILGAAAFVTEHSIVPELASGRPDENDRAFIKNFAQHVAHLATVSPIGPIYIPGNHPYRATPPIAVPIRTDFNQCQLCNQCVDRCPMGAISPNPPYEIDTSRCIFCMRCIRECPSQCRSLPKEVHEAILKHLTPFKDIYQKNVEFWPENCSSFMA